MATQRISMYAGGGEMQLVIDAVTIGNCAIATIKGLRFVMPFRTIAKYEVPEFRRILTRFHVKGTLEVNRYVSGATLPPIGEVGPSLPVYSYDEGLLYEFEGYAETVQIVTPNPAGYSYDNVSEASTYIKLPTAASAHMACDSAGEFDIPIIITATLYINDVPHTITYGNNIRAIIPFPKIDNPPAIYADETVCGQTAEITVLKSGVIRDLRWVHDGTETSIIPYGMKTERSTIRFQIPEEVANDFPNSMTGSITLHLLCYDKVGDEKASLDVTGEIPVRVMDYSPSVSADVYSVISGNRYDDMYIQSVSLLRAQVTASSLYSATITQITTDYDGLQMDGVASVFAQNNSGEKTITITVTDSRGRTAQYSETIHVQEYWKPTVKLERLNRSDADGTDNPSGAYAKVQFSGAGCPLDMGDGPYNTIRYQLCYRIRDSQWNYTNLTDYANNFQAAGTVISYADIESGYEFFVSAEDRFFRIESYVQMLPVAAALLDISKANKSMGIGIKASSDPEQKETLNVGWKMKLHQHPITDVKMNDEPEEDDAATVGYVRKLLQGIYPVGSIWLTIGSEDPGDIFGGTWEKIEGRYLLASGSTIAAGSTGGEETHKHTVSGTAQIYVADNGNVISHRENDVAAWSSNHNSSGGTHGTASTSRNYGSTISGTAEEASNMPPYIAINVWRRSA